MIITAVYVPPSNSRYGNIEDFIDIDNFLLDYSEDYLHLLCGDFNSHTGTLPYYATPNENFHDNIIGDDVLANLLDVFIDFDRYGIDCARYSQDMSHDKSTYGKNLLEICKNNHICIFNGRVGEDHGVGKASTVYSTLVDYIIGSPLIFTKIKNFKVMDFDPLLSDVHCGIQVNFKIDIMCNIKKIIQSKQLTNTKSDKPGKWKSYKAKEYVDEVDVDKVKNLLLKAHAISVQTKPKCYDETSTC